MEWHRHPKRGFRFSLTDGVAILVCAVATWWLLPTMGSHAWLLPFVLGHFFLFCNLFRIPRNDELFWAASFLIVYVGCMVMNVGWKWIAGIQLPITALVLLNAMRYKSYHGIFANKINPVQVDSVEADDVDAEDRVPGDDFRI